MAAAQKKPASGTKTTAAKSTASPKRASSSATAARKTQSAKAASQKSSASKASSLRSSRSSMQKTSQRTAAARANSRKTATKGYSSSAKRKKNNAKNRVQVDYTIVNDIAVIAVFVFCVILQLSCFFTGGGLMQLLHTYNFRWFGALAYCMPILLFLLPCFVISNWRNRGLIQKVIAIVIFFLSIETVLSEIYETTDFFTIGGGAVGHGIFRLFYGALGAFGTYIVMAAFLLISWILFFGHSVMTEIRQNSKIAYRAVSSYHKLNQGRRKIRAQEKRIHREQEENEQLEMQRLRLEALQKQRQEILEKRNLNRQFVNIQLEESKRHEEQTRELLKKQSARAKRELRTNTELEEEDRSMKEIILEKENDLKTAVEGRKTNANVENTASIASNSNEEVVNSVEAPELQKTQEKPPMPSMFIEGEEISPDFSKLFEESGDSLSKPIKLDLDANSSADLNETSNDTINESSNLASNEDSNVISNVNLDTQRIQPVFELDDGWVREPDEAELAEQQTTKSDSIETDQIESDQTATNLSEIGSDVSDSFDQTEDFLGESAAGDDSVDYRMLMRDTKNTGKPNTDESVYTKTVTTATGKVITVELDGLPGENKRPKDSKTVQENTNPYGEQVVPIAYEEPKEYVFPSTELLTPGNSSGKGKEEIARIMQETADKLKRTLQDFGVGVTITNISRGPSVTRYELQPEQGVKVSKVVNLADDIKLNLAAEDIRIEAPIPGKAAIGIEVPNKEKQMVAFRDLLESDEFTKAKSKTVFAAGKDIAGKTVVADIEKMPHLLIAGQTGSGKSVCINTIIMSILYKARPSEVKLIMIDPKVVELSVYNGIPHLLIPVVTDPKKAAAALNWAVNEMEERYKKFAQHKARNIIGYNAQIDQIEDVPGKDRPEKIPQIIVIVDELADLMMTAGTDVEDAIQKLAQKARAAGIHLIIATQRPSVNVITGVIKANIPSRIAFSVASGIDSRTILDETGAEKLLGKGDMLFHPYYISKPVRVQGAFVSDDEVTEVVNFLTQQKNVKGGEINTNIDLQANMPGGKLPGGEQDELFETAGRFIIEQEKASIGNLQRHLRIGFNRAARIMDQLYAAGVVSKDEGTKPRKVLMKAEEFEDYLTGR